MFPIGTDNPLQRKPVVNYALVLLNFVIFLYTYQPHVIQSHGQQYHQSIRKQAQQFKLYPREQLHPQPQKPQIHQFVTYAFLHAGWMHIIGNMLFLYIFGNSVNDKLGHVGYLLLYFGGAIFSGLGHALFNNAPVLGASGAVATVTGAYMVLFPKTYINVLYIFIFIGTVEVPALYFILFKLIIYDNVLEPRMSGGGNVAYGAHLAGYIFGIGVPLAMLALKWLPHSHYDMWALIRRWRRRREFSSITNDGYDPFEQGGAGRETVKVKAGETEHSDPKSKEIRRLRTDISIGLNSGALDKAAGTYLELLEIDREQVLPQQQQLDVANKLMQLEKYEAAAAGYESFIKHYRKSYPFMEQIELMLGLLYSRYLRQNEPAIKHLGAAVEKLSDAGQKQMCRDELSRLESE